MKQVNNMKLCSAIFVCTDLCLFIRELNVLAQNNEIFLNHLLIIFSIINCVVKVILKWNRYVNLLFCWRILYKFFTIRGVSIIQVIKQIITPREIDH